jgi:hypothetical protein
LTQLPQVRVSFFLVGDEFNLDNVTKKMNIMPTDTREKKDCPVKQFAYTTWSLRTEKDSCKAVSVQFERIMKLLLGKEKIINEICNTYNSNVIFEIGIFMENGDRPEMVLTKEIILFLASINAEVGFDLYVD